MSNIADLQAHRERKALAEGLVELPKEGLVTRIMACELGSKEKPIPGVMLRQDDLATKRIDLISVPLECLSVVIEALQQALRDPEGGE